MESRPQKLHSISWVYKQMKASSRWDSSLTNKMSEGGSSWNTSLFGHDAKFVK